MNKYILLDTNILRRLIEEKPKVQIIMNYFKFNKYLFYVSDYSLFELMDNLDRSKNKEDTYNKVISIINKYDIELLYRESSKDLFDNYNYFLESKYTIKEVKRILYKSFKFSLMNFLKDIYSICILSIANSLEECYTSSFYNYIRHIFKSGMFNEKVSEHLNRVLDKGYIANNLKIEKFVKEDMKDLIIRVLCYYDLLKNKESFTSEEFNEKKTYYISKYKDISFNNILKNFYKPNKVKLINMDNVDAMQFEFSENYFKNISNGKRLSINDLVDYLNLEKAFKNQMLYYTEDNNFFTRYETYFKDNQEVLDYISEIKKINKLPYNVLNQNT